MDFDTAWLHRMLLCLLVLDILHYVKVEGYSDHALFSIRK